ncbi:MAG: YkgJ family cysteine cluster protein [Deltaproteobacteria bacterium]|nr:YkgJ family cysteine cluster protein [Deltaproteobacteria bacterium]MBW1873014.1 YkgJ family cysteine cluster protein [Deltaproteobacteria bacterium]
MNDPLEAYQQLIEKLDNFFSQANSKYKADMDCCSGCDDCCQRDLWLYPFEVARLIEGFSELAADCQKRITKRAQEAQLSTEAACPFLEEGCCLVYNLRPIICRTHGLAMLIPGTHELSVCPRNFLKVEHIDGDCVLDLTPVNQILATVNDLVCRDARASNQRVRVSQAILQTGQEESRP